MGTVVDDAASEEFHAFFERHYAELSRLAHLLTGEADAADDLAADALLALWHRWDRVRAADHPAAYARGVVANLARTRIRSAVRERRRVALFWSQREEKTENPDVAGVVDVQEALRRLPFRKRACVVLRHAFDLSEKDTALALGVSVGTVKSQTSKGMAELQRLLGPQSPRCGCTRRWHAAARPEGGPDEAPGRARRRVDRPAARGGRGTRTRPLPHPGPARTRHGRTVPPRPPGHPAARVRLGAGGQRHGRGGERPRDRRLRGGIRGEEQHPRRADGVRLTDPDPHAVTGRDEPYARQTGCPEPEFGFRRHLAQLPRGGHLPHRPRDRRTLRTPALPAASGTQDGPLWSDGSIDPGSNDFWAQSDITLKTTKQLTALTVQLKVKLTAGVTSAGAWRSLPEQDFTQTVTERGAFLVYTWVLKEGRTVAVGDWVFAGQYNHARGGRDAKDDSYSAAGTAAGQQLAVKGDFAAQKS